MSASFLKGNADRNHMGNNQVRYNSYKVVNLFFGIAIYYEYYYWCMVSEKVPIW